MIAHAPASTLPTTLDLTVRAYDSKELRKLQKLGCWNQIRAIAGTTKLGQTLSVALPQVLVYSMFRDLDCASLAQLRSDVDAQERRLRRIVRGSGQHIVAHPDLDANAHANEAEDFGIALALASADAIFGTSDMDWQVIPVGQSPSLDYKASNGTLIIELEAKGSFLDDSRLVGSSVSQHLKGIRLKKSSLGTLPPNVVRLGAITMIGKEPSHAPVVRLVDPPVADQDRTPEILRLLTRMRFLARWLSFVSPRSAISIALQNRVSSLNSLVDPVELDGLLLRDGRGEPLDATPRDGLRQHSPFFSNKSIVTDGPTGGWVVPVADGWLFFCGVMGDLVDLGVGQDFEAIRAYRHEPGTIEKTVLCHFSRRRFDGLRMRRSKVIERYDERYVQFPAKGELYYTAGGLAFGWLCPPEDLYEPSPGGSSSS